MGRSGSRPHQAGRESVLVAVAAEPVAAWRATHRRSARRSGYRGSTQLLEPVVELALPFAGEECLDRLPAARTRRGSPDAVAGRKPEPPARIAGVPGVLGLARLLLRSRDCRVGAVGVARSWRSPAGQLRASSRPRSRGSAAPSRRPCPRARSGRCRAGGTPRSGRSRL